MSDDPDLFGIYHARRTDPATSHEAARSVPVTPQMRAILKVYLLAGRPLIDHEAYRIAGYGGNRLTHQRCSDLREAKLIERLNGRRPTPSGKSAFLSQITELGRRWLRDHGDQ